ncbi:WD40-repeat-containing domain protein [Dendryphion nanum]|uniref:WD40-repeat-containing domain protein n=1 Tax=Dendryphion nanum TaxID=256645 RepID=A0A9P9DBY5_9PLEO|nr:WD40-repeat-containing domain protein [Dendryphion nanum]
MNGREIPGYYFDKEKGKYFKVQADKGQKYSRENIAKRQRRDRNENYASERVQKRKTQTIVAPHRKNLHFQTLQREIGDGRRSFFLHDIWPTASVAGYVQTDTLVKDSIRHFDVDQESKTIFAVSGERSIKRYPLEREIITSCDDLLSTTTSTVSSLNYLPASDTLVATTFGSDRPPVLYLTNPKTDGPFVGEQFTPKNCSAIWTSAPRSRFSTSNESTSSIHAADTEYVAFGASKDMKLLHCGPDGHWQYNSALETESDVLALTWLSPTIVCLGGRDGKIQIYDIRSQGSKQILMHPAPINHIRPADDFQRIAVSGLCSTLVLYDMRMGFTEQMGVGQWKKRKHSRFPFRKMSKCYTKFELHINQDIPELGMDVSPALGLVAAANEDASLSLYNLYTGKRVKHWDRTSPDRFQNGSQIRCVRFVKDHDGGETLMASCEGAVVPFSWDSEAPLSNTYDASYRKEFS